MVQCSSNWLELLDSISEENCSESGTTGEFETFAFKTFSEHGGHTDERAGDPPNPTIQAELD